MHPIYALGFLAYHSTPHGLSLGGLILDGLSPDWFSINVLGS